MEVRCTRVRERELVRHKNGKTEDRKKDEKKRKEKKEKEKKGCTIV